MEACAGAHHWGRELQRLGHEVRLIPPVYVKPFVKRQKNDAADAEAICEAAQRPTMRFVPVKSEEQQASAAVFRARDLLARQRTQLLNALRGLLAEHGWAAPKGLFHAGAMMAKIEDPACALLPSARDMFLVMIASAKALDERIGLLDREIAKRAREDETARRLMTIPGIGPITATALVALAPPPESIRKGRDFAAWVGLTPLQRSTGGKARLGSITRMGANVEALADPRQRCRRSSREQARCPQRILARADDGAKAARAGDRCACQQDGADRLGGARPRRSLSSSGCRGLKLRRA
jgi:transposase